jgi:hypothetical protein
MTTADRRFSPEKKGSMLIDARGNIKRSGNLQYFESLDWEIHWRGFIYSRGISAGLESVRKLASDLRDQRVQDLAQELRGAFILVIHRKHSGDYYVLVDNNGLFHAYYSDSALSTSFLELAASNGLRPPDLDPEAVVEFLHYGFVSFDRTLFRQIRKLAPEHIAHVSPGDGIILLPKSLAPLGTGPSEPVENVLRDLTASASAERISVDLTGGMDTRFLVLLLNFLGMRFEVAIRENDSDVDVRIARRVAAALGKDLHVCNSHIDNLENGLICTLPVCDGLCDILKSYGSLELQRNRAQRNISLMLSAAGGELFRDHFWLQDFPFYSQKKAHVDRFCSLRLLPTDPDHSYLVGVYRTASHDYRHRLLCDLSRYEVTGNTQTYDHIIYRVRYREFIGRFVTNHTHILQCYPPLMEREAVNYGYNMSRWSRFFDFYFRETATRCHPQAARLPTTRGLVTLSSEPSALAVDALKYLSDKLTRVTRRLGQKYFRRHYHSCGALDESLGHPERFATLRRLHLMRLAVERLHDYGILNPAVTVDNMKDEYLGTTLTLAMVMDHLDGITAARLNGSLRPIAVSPAGQEVIVP